MPAPPVDLDASRIALLAGASLVAGAVNAVAGGGSLISFPALLAVGYPALTANVTNTVALCPGYVGGTLGYRRELEGQRRRGVVLGLLSVVGALLGSWLLVVSSPELFETIVPWLIFLACGLLAAQPRLAAALRRRREAGDGAPQGRMARWGPLIGAQFVAAVYGAYFGAGVGIMMLAILGIFVADSLQRLNALKGLLSLVINVIAAVFFAFLADVAWVAVGVMAVTAPIGGQLGVLAARRLNDKVLRWIVVAFGVIVGLRLLVG
jgi:uncharacterized membrane protein YfcA